MRKIRILSILLTLCALFSVMAPASYALDDPDISAEAVVLADTVSGNILYEKNMNDQRSPASLTKIMTGLLAVEAVESGALNLDDVITAGEDCRQGLETDSSTAGIVAGEQMTFEDLMYCAMVVSANEACNIIGTAVSGSIQNFVNDMNRRARELGCTNTHFSDTNGLTNEDHYTSAYDLYLITREAMTHPKFVSLVTAKYYVVPATNVSEERELNTSNALMSPDGIYGDGYLYDGSAGVKTGFTKRAGYCLVSTATNDGRKLLAIVMGCRGPLANNPIADYGNFTETIKLYDWGFENFSYRTVISAGQDLGSEPVENASDGTTVTLHADADVTLLLPNDLSESSISIRTSLSESPLQAPIEEDQVLGTAIVSINGTNYGSVNIISFDSIKASGLAKITRAVKNFFTAGWLKIVVIIILAAGLIYLILLVRYRIMRRRHLKRRMQAAERRRLQRDAGVPESQRAPIRQQPERRRFMSGDEDELEEENELAEQAQFYQPRRRKAEIITDSTDGVREQTRVTPASSVQSQAPSAASGHYESLDPEQRETHQEEDIDELLRSLGLGKYI